MLLSRAQKKETSSGKLAAIPAIPYPPIFQNPSRCDHYRIFLGKWGVRYGRYGNPQFFIIMNFLIFMKYNLHTAPCGRRRDSGASF